jgi:hypothetical protein
METGMERHALLIDRSPLLDGTYPLETASAQRARKLGPQLANRTR